MIRLNSLSTRAPETALYVSAVVREGKSGGTKQIILKNAIMVLAPMVEYILLSQVEAA